jgi:Glycosyl transferases group 1
LSRALVFFPQNPWPAKCGFHRRGLEMLLALRDLGFDTVLASSDLSAAWGNMTWNAEGVSVLTKRFVSSVRLHETSDRDRQFSEWLTKTYRRCRREPPLSTRVNTPPGMRRWFAELVEEVSPDLLVMNYVFWDGLVDHGRWRRVRRVLDTIDLVTLNRRMWRRLESALPSFPVDPALVPESATTLNFFDDPPIRPEAAEFRIHDRYDVTVAITEQERQAIGAAARGTRAVHIPMTHQVKDLPNSYAGPPLFVTGPNPFNIQGHLFLVKHVLPDARAQAEDLVVKVTGYCSANVKASSGILQVGFVDDLTTLYVDACFAVCPVFGLTGQQVKIVEAMAHGVPVIALEAAARRSPIEHDINGLVAHDAAEFAEQMVRLWCDRSLCRRLGEAARETIRNNFSPGRLREALADALSTRHAGAHF